MAPVSPLPAVTNIKQYPMPPAAKQGIKEVINKDLEQRGIIFGMHSAYNSPACPVKKTRQELVFNS